MGGEPFHHRFILLKVRYRLDSRRKCLMLDVQLYRLWGKMDLREGTCDKTSFGGVVFPFLYSALAIHRKNG
jgi:hypothetical protein